MGPDLTVDSDAPHFVGPEKGEEGFCGAAAKPPPHKTSLSFPFQDGVPPDLLTTVTDRATGVATSRPKAEVAFHPQLLVSWI